MHSTKSLEVPPVIVGVAAFDQLRRGGGTPEGPGGNGCRISQLSFLEGRAQEMACHLEGAHGHLGAGAVTRDGTRCRRERRCEAIDVCAG